MTKKLMQFEKFNSAQDLSLFIHSKTERSSLITKGYSSNNSAQKIYFGCFDWKKSIFEN
jgi:phage anti-repressor protein